MAYRHLRPPTHRRPSLEPLDVCVLAASLVGGPVLVAAASTLLTRSPAGPSQEVAHALGLLAAIGAALLLAWWILGLVGLALMGLGARAGRVEWERLGARIAPAVLRRVAAATLGVHVLAAPAAWAAPASPAPTVASTVDASWAVPPRSDLSAGTASEGTGSARAAADTGLRPAPTPQPGVPARTIPGASWLPAAPSPPPPGSVAAPRVEAARPTVTVRAGDCLWDLAAAELGPDATPVEIDLRWRAWHRANRSVIGDDPHLLLPGTVLTVPVFSPHVDADASVR